MRSGRPVRTHNLRLLVFFGILVLILVVSSLVLKFISLAGESRFDGEHFFVVSFLHPKGADIVGFDPKNKKITILHAAGNSVPSNLQQSLAIPIDGKVNGEIVSAADLSSALFDMLLGYSVIKTNLTILDIGRLAFFAKTVSQSNIIDEPSSLINGVTADSAVSDLFIDSAIQKEKVTVEIVNATGHSGLGQRLERLLSNMGGNIIAVTTSPKIMKTSSMTYFGDKTYTLLRISSIVTMPLVYTEKPQLADITIFIGEDIVNTERF
ncbi:MAG: LytR C-terminal domain-containing protein [Candidatus Levybacteria bacterium]|nr:LytR C-terminal domain-containing protein [Candidatus Levybacteria bacterium]